MRSAKALCTRAKPGDSCLYSSCSRRGQQPERARPAQANVKNSADLIRKTTPVAIAQPDPVRLHRLQFQHCRQPLQQLPQVVLHGAVLDPFALASEMRRPLQELQHRRRKNRVSRIDLVLQAEHLVDLVHLHLRPMTLRRAEQVSHPRL